MKNNNIKKNLWYQSLYNVIITILPLITAPYLARHLGVTSQGIYSYTNSIVNYFTLIAMLGIVNYGTKSIADSKDKQELCNKKFSSIYVIQIFSSFLALTLYLLYLFFFAKENLLISAIQIISILSCFLDINWLFMGFEDFKFIVFRNTIFRIVSVILILIFVKNASDLWIYTLIMVGGVFFSNITLWFKLKKYVSIKKPRTHDIIDEIKPILILFIPLLALSIYHIMDKTMLGLLSNYDNVGFYYNADKVINIPIGIITGISTVLFPRSVVVLKKSHDEFKLLMLKGMELTILVSTIISFGIASISYEFTPLFFGNGFDPCIILIIVLSPVMIIKSISTIVRYQYLIPINKENIFIYSVIGGAIINLILNLLLIPKYGAIGAVVGTLGAELAACTLQFIFAYKELLFLKKLLISFISYILIGIIMFLCVRIVALNLNVSMIYKLILEILVGGMCYISLLIIYLNLNKKTTIDFKELLIKVRKKY